LQERLLSMEQQMGEMAELMKIAGNKVQVLERQNERPR